MVENKTYFYLKNSPSLETKKEIKKPCGFSLLKIQISPSGWAWLTCDVNSGIELSAVVYRRTGVSIMDGVESNAFSHSTSLLSLSYPSSSFESDNNESDAELDASGVLGSEYQYAAIEPYLYGPECSEEEAASDQYSPSGHFQEHRLTNKDW